MFGVSAGGDRPHVHDPVAVDGVEDIVEIDGGIGVRRKQLRRGRRSPPCDQAGSAIVACSSLSDVTVAPVDSLHRRESVILGHRLVAAVGDAAIARRPAHDGAEHRRRPARTARRRWVVGVHQRVRARLNLGDAVDASADVVGPGSAADTTRTAVRQRECRCAVATSPCIASRVRASRSARSRTGCRCPS